MPIPKRKPTDGITLQEMHNQLQFLLSNKHALIKFCVSRDCDEAEVIRFAKEVEERLKENKMIYVDKATYRSVIADRQNPKRMPHIGKKELAKAAKRVTEKQTRHVEAAKEGVTSFVNALHPKVNFADMIKK